MEGAARTQPLVRTHVRFSGTDRSTLIASTLNYGLKRLSPGAAGSLNPRLGSKAALGSPPAGAVFAASTGILHYAARPFLLACGMPFVFFCEEGEQCVEGE